MTEAILEDPSYTDKIKAAIDEHPVLRSLQRAGADVGVTGLLTCTVGKSPDQRPPIISVIYERAIPQALEALGKSIELIIDGKPTTFALHAQRFDGKGLVRGGDWRDDE